MGNNNYIVISFTKGLAPRLVRKPLANSISFLLVEHLNHLFYGT